MNQGDKGLDKEQKQIILLHHKKHCSLEHGIVLVTKTVRNLHTIAAATTAEAKQDGPVIKTRNPTIMQVVCAIWAINNNNNNFTFYIF